MYLMLKRLILLYFLVHQNGEAVRIPESVFVSKEFGFFLEPESMVLHFENNLYMTVGIDMELIPNSNQLAENTACHLTDGERRSIHGNLTGMMDQFIKGLPIHFSPLPGHYCGGNTVDCFFESNNTLQRSKRQVILTMLAVAGIASAGVGMYNLLNDAVMKDHLQQIETQADLITNKVRDAKTRQLEYNKVNNALFVKTHFGIAQMAKMIKDDLCQASQVVNDKSNFIMYSMVISNFKQQFHDAMDGKVTDFLVTESFLKENILSRPELTQTAYSVDPGLFYSTSTSLLYKVDVKKKIAYFLISVPIILGKDISPIYSISNMGWIEGDVHYRVELPKKVYYYTENTEIFLMSPSLDQCRTNHGYHVCPSSGSSRTHQEQCLENIIHHNNTDNCQVLANNKEITCDVSISKGGIAYRSCEDVFKIRYLRQVQSVTKIQQSENKFNFIQYQDFKQMSINGKLYSTKTYNFKSVEGVLHRPNFIPSFDIDKTVLSDIDVDIMSLKQKTEEMRNSNIYKIHHHIQSNNNHYLIGGTLITLIIFLALGIFYFHKKGNKKEEPRVNLLDLLKERRNGVY